MNNKANMCILFHDDAVDVVFVDRSMLGAQIKLTERLPRDEAVFEAVAGLMASTGKTPGRVTLVIPRDMAIQRTLRYPVVVMDEMAGMVRNEATRHVPFAENERMLAWAVAESPDGKQAVLDLVAARSPDVRGLVERFEEAGVPVDEAVSFASLVAPQLADMPGLLVLVDERHLELCLYGEGMLQGSQSIPRSNDEQDRVLAAARQMMARNKAWLGSEGVSRVLIGGPCEVDGFGEDLGTAFGLHVRQLELPEALASLVGEAQLPFIDSLIAATVEAPPSMNLLEDRHRKVPINKRTVALYALCLLFVFEILATYAFRIGAPALERRKTGRELEELRRETASIQAMKEKNKIYHRQLEQLAKVCSSSTGTMEVLKTLSDSLPEDTYLQEISCGREDIVLKGSSKEPGKLPELVMALPFVATINASDIGSERDGYYEFSMTARLRR
jgi:hypothetical protein